MKRVEDKEYAHIQALELGYWTHTPYNPTGPWPYYDKVFAPYLDTEFDVALDYGSGPVPYLCNPIVRYVQGWAVDPLMYQYMQMERYDAARGDAKFDTLGSLDGIIDNCVNALFALNVLDHVQNPAKSLRDIMRVLANDGLLFIFCDVNKEPDAVHPHIIDDHWLASALGVFCKPEYIGVGRSWKYNADVLWFVGRKL